MDIGMHTPINSETNHRIPAGKPSTLIQNTTIKVETSNQKEFPLERST